MARPAQTDLNALNYNLKDQVRLRRIIRGLQVLIDIAMLLAAFGLGYLARQYAPLLPVIMNTPRFTAYTSMMLIHVVTMVVIFFFARMYHQRRTVSRIDLVYTVAASAGIGAIMTSGLTTIFLKGTETLADYPRQMILYVWFFSVLCVTAGREIHRQIAIKARVVGLARDRVVIVGSGTIAQSIIRQILYNPTLGYTIVGVVNGDDHQAVEGVSVIGHPEDLPRLIDSYGVDEVIIALPEAPHKDLVELIAWCQRGRVNIKIYPDLFAYMAGGMSVDELGGMPLLNVRDVALRGWKLTLKRSLDIIGSTIGLIVLSPLMLLTAVIIKLDSKGSVFFAQERCGLDGQPFPMIKFRTMRQDAEVNGPGWTVENDPRITHLGSWMRKTNWDEITQLINVLLGQMSLVGPRPEQTAFVQKFRGSIPRYMERHREKAGMTGWAQVNGLRGDTSLEERTKFDVWYVEHWSLWLDIKIIIRTIFQTIIGKSPNAY
ncbi:MAG: undecaprenyl-phosphate glucose phosphotransferase [Chloroflexota bacterium]